MESSGQASFKEPDERENISPIGALGVDARYPGLEDLGHREEESLHPASDVRGDGAGEDGRERRVLARQSRLLGQRPPSGPPEVLVGAAGSLSEVQA